MRRRFVRGRFGSGRFVRERFVRRRFVHARFLRGRFLAGMFFAGAFFTGSFFATALCAGALAAGFVATGFFSVVSSIAFLRGVPALAARAAFALLAADDDSALRRDVPLGASASTRFFEPVSRPIATNPQSLPPRETRVRRGYSR